MPLTRTQEEIETMAKALMKEFINNKYFLSSLTNKIAEDVSAKINERLESLQDKCNKLEEKVEILEKENKDLNSRLDSVEQTLKKGTLRFHGVKEKSEGMTKESLLDIIKTKLELDIHEEDILACYRIGGHDGSVKPIMVKFGSWELALKILLAKRKLKGTGIYVYEELTKQKMVVMKAAKNKFGKKMVWSWKGVIYVNNNGVRKTLQSVADINSE